MVWHVYALSDPLTDDIFYVGLTRQPPHIRLDQHYRNRSNDLLRFRLQWLKSKGLTPGVRTLETIADGPWYAASDAERRWVTYYSAFYILDNERLNRPSTEPPRPEPV